MDLAPLQGPLPSLHGAAHARLLVTPHGTLVHTSWQAHDFHLLASCSHARSRQRLGEIWTAAAAWRSLVLGFCWYVCGLDGAFEQCTRAEDHRAADPPRVV